MMKRTVKTLTIRNTYRSLTLRALCLLLLLLRLSAALAGGNYRFTHLTSAQGLPHQQVEALAQDARGYIWIGMRNGLVRYDGYSTKVYSHDEKNPHSLYGLCTLTAVTASGYARRRAFADIVPRPTTLNITRMCGGCSGR